MIVDLDDPQKYPGRLYLELIVELWVVEHDLYPGFNFVDEALGCCHLRWFNSLQTQLFDSYLIIGQWSIHWNQFDKGIEGFKSHLTDRTVFFNQFISQIFNEFSLANPLQ